MYAAQRMYELSPDDQRAAVIGGKERDGLYNDVALADKTRHKHTRWTSASSPPPTRPGLGFLTSQGPGTSTFLSSLSSLQELGLSDVPSTILLQYFSPSNPNRSFIISDMISVMVRGTVASVSKGGPKTERSSLGCTVDV